MAERDGGHGEAVEVDLRPPAREVLHAEEPPVIGDRDQRRVPEIELRVEEAHHDARPGVADLQQLVGAHARELRPGRPEVDPRQRHQRRALRDARQRRQAGLWRRGRHEPPDRPHLAHEGESRDGLALRLGQRRADGPEPPALHDGLHARCQKRRPGLWRQRAVAGRRRAAEGATGECSGGRRSRDRLADHDPVARGDLLRGRGLCTRRAAGEQENEGDGADRREAEREHRSTCGGGEARNATELARDPSPEGRQAAAASGAGSGRGGGGLRRPRQRPEAGR